MKKFLIVFVSFFLILMLGCQKENEKQEEKLVPVKVFELKPDNIGNYFRATGTITAGEDVMIYSKATEKIEKIFVKPGDQVKAEQILAVQYNSLFKQNVEAAENGVKSAEVNLKMLQQDFNRMKSLFEQKAISIQQFEQIKTQYESANIALESAKVQLQQAKEQFENSFIRSPINGTIASINIEKNQMVAAGIPVIQVISGGSMKAKVKIPATEISSIRKGQNVNVNFPAIPDKTFNAVISEIDAAIDQVSKTLEIEVTLMNTDYRVKSGMFAEFLIETSSKKNAIVIPEGAIQSRTEVQIDRQTGIQNSIKKFFVFVIKNGKAELTEIQTGINNDGRTEIIKGLNAGDVIVVVGQNIVKSGDKVKIID